MRYFRYSDAGLNFFSNGLITHNSTIDDNSELAQSMLDVASESATRRPSMIPRPRPRPWSVSTRQTPAGERRRGSSGRGSIPLLNTPATTGKAPGTNAEQDWTSTIATLNEAGLLKTDKAPADYWASSFRARRRGRIGGVRS